MRVAIIGAGLAGLTAAGVLRRAGLCPVVYDKGRGVGGRMATRRADGGLQFDHGAQYLSVEDPGFAELLQKAEAAGAARTWAGGPGVEGVIGIPGMNAIAKFLAADIDVRKGVEIPSIRAGTRGWAVGGKWYDRVISTVPAPQAMKLIGDKHPFVDALNSVVMEPNLTLMLALPRANRAPSFWRDPDNDIAWLALDSGKLARKGPECWVAQAGRAWSKTHLELDKADIAKALLPLVCEKLRADPSDALYVAAHRWRYAEASSPLGKPYLTDAGTLFLGGDWALSNRAEGAWLSGTAIAQALLETR